MSPAAPAPNDPPPGKALLPLEEALATLRAAARPVAECETLVLDQALGRVLAVDQYATLDVPPWDNSAMDGYAVRASDGGRALPVSLRIAAGSGIEELPEHACARIFTGAPVPRGADAVVMQEDVTHDETGEVLLPAELHPGENIRPRAQDCARGDLLLSAGRCLRPQDLGLLASQGIAQVPVLRPLRVALLSTGSELVEAGVESLAPGAIYNSNRPLLAAMLRNLGCEVLDLGIVPDDPVSTATALRRGSEAADLVLSSGGVSVGEADYVRAAVEDLGELSLWRIAIKPGKPFAFGRVAATPFIGLPGNPASAFVTFALLARPYIAALQGRSDGESAAIRARATFSVPRAGKREEYLRVSLRTEDGELWADAYPNQSSGVLRSLVASDALARVPVGSTLAEGDPIDVLPLDLLLR